jgi:hypothetical protein
MNREAKIVLLLCVFTISFHSSNALAENDDARQLATLNQIVRGEGKPGDTATSKNGEVIYVVLEGGIVEIRNTRYNTTHRYSIVKPEANSRSK